MAARKKDELKIANKFNQQAQEVSVENVEEEKMS